MIPIKVKNVTKHIRNIDTGPMKGDVRAMDRIRLIVLQQSFRLIRDNVRHRPLGGNAPPNVHHDHRNDYENSGYLGMHGKPSGTMGDQYASFQAGLKVYKIENHQ